MSKLRELAEEAKGRIREEISKRKDEVLADGLKLTKKAISKAVSRRLDAVEEKIGERFSGKET